MMKVVETAITETTVRIRLADSAGPAAKVWIDAQLSRDGLVRLSNTPVNNLPKLELKTVQQVILENAKDAIDAEIKRLAQAP